MRTTQSEPKSVSSKSGRGNPSDDHSRELVGLKIANSFSEISVSADARDLGEILETLKELDRQRISQSDGVVIRKGVLALLEVVGRIEERVFRLEQNPSDALESEGKSS